MRIKVARISLGERCPSPRGTFRSRFRTFTYFLTKKMDNTSWAIKDTYQRLWSNDDIFQLLANDIKNGHKLTWDSKIYWRKGSCLKFCSFFLLTGSGKDPRAGQISARRRNCFSKFSSFHLSRTKTR